MHFDTPLVASTSFNARRIEDIGAILDELMGLGFERIELGYLVASQLARLEDELASRGMAVQSVHNPAPWPVRSDGVRLVGSPMDTLASPDETRRRWMLDLSKRTIDYAQGLGALAVVIHLGQTEIPLPQSELFDLLAAGRLEEMRSLRDELLAARERIKRPYIDAALLSIRELGEHAIGSGLRLGVETRDQYHEVATIDDLDEVLAATQGLPVGYWHDVGHVEKQRQLGIATHEDWVRRHGARIVGAHIHDTVLERDHLAPGRGNTDFAEIARLLPPNTLRTLELGTRPTLDEAREGIALLSRVGLA